MTLKSTWSIASDDENSRQSFLSDCDSEFDLSPPPRYSTEKCSIPALKKFSLNRNEPPLTRSRAKAGLVSKEARQSTHEHRADPITEISSTFTSSILFPKQQLSKNRVPSSPTDGVNKLADWFESCSLDENKCSKDCLWSSGENNRHSVRSILSSSSKNTLNSNSFSISQTSPAFFQTTSTTTLFGQQPAHLWSRFRFAASTIQNNFWPDQFYSTPANTLNFSNNNNNNTSHFSDHPSVLSPLNLFASSPLQTVPSLFTKVSLPSVEKTSPSVLKQHHPVRNSALPTIKEDLMAEQSSSKIFFTLIIFLVGLVLGYLLTNTFPSDHLCHWFFTLEKTSIQISIKYLHLLSDYLQVIMKYFSLNI